MDRSMKRLSLLFLVLFALALGGVRLYDHLVMEPAERCVREGAGTTRKAASAPVRYTCPT